MLIDLVHDTPNADVTYDVCVIGAGAAGIALCNELILQNKRVLLLESGGLNFEDASQQLYAGEATGVTFEGLLEGRARVFGGTTTEWGGQVLELNELDFKRRSWIEGSGWPLNKDELVSDYKRAIEFEGLELSPSDPQEIWKKLGLSPLKIGSELISEFSQWSPVPNFAKSHFKKFFESKLVTVCLHANACEFNFGEFSNIIESVNVRTLTGKSCNVRARQFVLCVGAIETCRLLLQPRANRKIAPWSDNRYLGRHFNEHISCFAADIYDLRVDPVRGYFDYTFVDGFKFHPKMKMSDDVQEKYKTLNVCGTISFVVGQEEIIGRAYKIFRLVKKRRFSEISRYDYIFLLRHMPALLWHITPYHFSAWSAARLAAASVKLCVHCEQSPYSESQITLTTARDQLGLFRPKIDWRISEEEISSIARYVEIARATFAREGIGRVVPIPELINNPSDIVTRCKESYHQMGGTRMASTDSEGVVDPNLRVFGTKNLYICSCSVFPTSGFANPTHTLIALAMRLARYFGSNFERG